MRGIYGGEFIGFRIATDAEQDEALREAVLAVDANILLDLYRYRERTSDDLLATLTAVGDRLIVPHQALREFWRHRSRDQTTSSAANKSVSDSLRKAARAQGEAIRGWGKQVGAGTEETSHLVRRIEEFAEELVEETAESRPVVETSADSILRRLEGILDGRVTDPLPSDEHAECLAEARRRIEMELPPGFKDADKETDNNSPDGGCGDYLVWYQATRFAARVGKDLIIVTRDEKEDWWWRQRSEFLGPRPELTAEFHELCQRRLFLMRPADLLERAPSALLVEVDSGSPDDANRVAEEFGAEDATAQWTLEAVSALLQRLDSEAPVQAQVLRLAGSAPDGHVTREQVFTLAGYPEDRTLRGFTRPYRRLTSLLQEEGAIPEGVPRIFVAEYPDGVTTSYFSVPPEVPALLRDLTT